MKNTVKLFGLIALIAMIGFAACDDENNSGNTGPGNTEGDITWSFIVNGAADTEDSTRITLTFSAAITGLTVGDITLTGGTGSAAKGSLSGSGSGYVLFITVTTPGTVSLKVTKDGVSAAAQDVTVYKKQNITWSAAVNGTLSAVDSSKITFTFSTAVDGLTKDDIILVPITVPVTKGELTGGGTSWELGITVTKQGYITAAVAKTGVNAAAQQVQLFKAAADPISAGRKTYINDGEQVVFSGGGTYTLNSHGTALDGNNKWIWEPKAEGSYTWDSSAQTLTLTADKVADDDGLMTAKASAPPLFVGWVQGEIENEIEDRLKWSSNAPYNETRNDAEAAVLEARNEENGTAYITMDEVIDYLAGIRFDEMFAVRSYTYTFSSDGVSLILLEAPPAPVGTDELAGKTFNGTISNWLTGVSVKDPNHTYVFFPSGRTFIETSLDEVEGNITTSTGCYSYDSTAKRVYLQPATRNGKTPEQYYDEADYYTEFDHLPEADSRASQTNQYFKLLQYDYDPETNVIDSKGSDEVSPLSYQW